MGPPTSAVVSGVFLTSIFGVWHSILPASVTVVAFEAEPIAPPLRLLMNFALASPAAGTHSSLVVGAVTTTVTVVPTATSPMAQCSTLPAIGLHVPCEVEENDQVSGPGSVSSSATAVAVPGPRFFSVIV